MMIKPAMLLLCLMFPAGLLLAEPLQLDISGDELLSGDADEALQTVGRRAAREGRTVFISAPDYWQDQVLEQLRAGARGSDFDVEVREVFVESIIVRLAGDSDAPLVIPGRVPAIPDDPEPEVASARPVVEVEIERPQTRAAEPDRDSVLGIQDAAAMAAEMRRETAAIASAPAVSAERAATPALPAVSAPEPAPTPEPERPVEPAPLQPAPELVEPPAAEPVAAIPDEPPVDRDVPVEDVDFSGTDVADSDEIRRMLEQSINFGRPITRALTVSQLDVGDLIYAYGDVRAVVRRERVRPAAFWLEGELDLARPEISEQVPGRYRVDMHILRGAVSVQRSPIPLVAVDPETDPEGRTVFEQRFNQGRTITRSLAPADLRPRDLLYTGTGSSLVVVVRRESSRLDRYWLQGEVDLASENFVEEVTNRWRVMRTPR